MATFSAMQFRSLWLYFLGYLVATDSQISFETNSIALHFNIYSAFFLFLDTDIT